MDRYWKNNRLPSSAGEAGLAVTQRRPRVSKLRLKGLFDYHSSEVVVEAARRRRACGPNKGATLTEYLLKKRELDNSSKPRAKGSPSEKNTTSQKELLTLIPGNIADG